MITRQTTKERLEEMMIAVTAVSVHLRGTVLSIFSSSVIIWTCHPPPRTGRKYLLAQAGNSQYLSSAHLLAQAGNLNHRPEASIKLHQR